MPKLISIKVNLDYLIDIKDITENKSLNTVTTIHLTNGSSDTMKPWLIRILPNLKNLILSHSELSLSKNELASILTDKIESLNILTNSTLEKFIKMGKIYFSNVKYIQLTICFKSQKTDIYANEIKKILTDFKNLNQLSINLCGRGNWSEIELTTMLTYLNTKDMERNYEINRYHEYVMFLNMKSVV